MTIAIKKYKGIEKVEEEKSWRKRSKKKTM